MKILILARGYPNPNSPLRGVFEFDQAKALKDFGHQVIYVSLDLRSIRRVRKWGRQWLVSEGIDVLNISIPLGNLPRQLLSFFGIEIFLFFFKEVLGKFGTPDIIHAHFAIFGKIASVVKLRYNIPIVITEHSSHVNKSSLPKVFKNYLTECYKSADRLIVVSTALSKKINSFLGYSAVVVPNIVDTAIFEYKRGEVVNTEGFVFISVASLDKNKAIGLLIDAFAEACLGDNVFLKIVGDGPLLEPLKRKVIDCGKQSNIFFLGRQSRSNIATLFSSSNVFVLPSQSETFGVVYIEALLSGLPVVATKCGGPEDFINSDNGLLIPVNDKDSLIAALKIMQTEAGKYNPDLISQECKARFAPDVIANKLSNIYKEILLANGK